MYGRMASYLLDVFALDCKMVLSKGCKAALLHQASTVIQGCMAPLSRHHNSNSPPAGVSPKRCSELIACF